MSTKKHACQKCEKTFRDAYELRRHLKRKTPCVPSSVPVVKNGNPDNVCKFCGKSYASIYSLRRHQRNCNMATDQQLMMKIVLQQDEKIAELEAKLAEVSSSVVPVSQTVINNNVTVNQVQQNLYVNVTICSFGKEDLSKLDTNKVMTLLKGQVKDFMPRMIEHVHANPDHPEYHNVFYDPERQKAIVFAPISDTEMSWTAQDFSEISKRITEKIKEHIRPGAGPYFDDAMKLKDTETANKIIQIANEVKYDSPEALEEQKGSLTQVTKNQGFLEQVTVME
jgi:hypothetical protein